MYFVLTLYGVQVVGGSNPLAPTSKFNGLHIYLCRPFSFRDTARDTE
jgi:hypothetical protein